MILYPYYIYCLIEKLLYPKNLKPNLNTFTLSRVMIFYDKRFTITIHKISDL